MEIGQIFQQKYQVLRFLGKGGFGQVIEAKNLLTNQHVAIKIDIKRKGPCLKEAKILSRISSAPGFPQILESGTSQHYTYMSLQLLGPNINQAMKKFGGTLDPGTISDIGLQCIARLQHLHSFGYVHRDIKPQQFLLGKDEIIYLVDYGLAKRFMKNNQHIMLQNRCLRAGNSSFASINNHMGVRQSRRDDLESVGYMLVYLLKGRLPWQMPKERNSKVKWQKVFNIKSQISLLQLCQNCPNEFSSFISYARMLKYDEEPNYCFLKNLLRSVWIRNKSSIQTLFRIYKLDCNRKSNKKRKSRAIIGRQITFDHNKPVLPQVPSAITIQDSISKQLSETKGNDATNYQSGQSLSDTFEQTFNKVEEIPEELDLRSFLNLGNLTPRVRMPEIQDRGVFEKLNKTASSTPNNKNCIVF